MRTQINWMLHNYCTSECSYCPTRLRGGSIPRGILEYIEVTTQLIDHYELLDRKIDWSFNGGEPLDMFDFPMMLKLCKERGGIIDLTTNGGKLWLDWWAIEPYIDTIHLSYHYWQNPNLIQFIIQAFQKSGKKIDIVVPIRPTYFDVDLKRALDVESKFNIVVSKSVLYKEADQSLGMYKYEDYQLRIMHGEELVEKHKHDQKITFSERFKEKLDANPSFTGQLCNLGIEKLNISPEGWVRGSNCNTTQFGNIWVNNAKVVSDAEKAQRNLNKLQLPTTPAQCVMTSCIDESDQQITKFKL